MITVVIWVAIVAGITIGGRVDDEEWIDPEDNISTLEKFDPSPADLPKGPYNSN